MEHSQKKGVNAVGYLSNFSKAMRGAKSFL